MSEPLSFVVEFGSASSASVVVGSGAVVAAAGPGYSCRQSGYTVGLCMWMAVAPFNMLG